MAPRILWPQHYWWGDTAPETSLLGEGVEPVFVRRLADVTDEQWRTAEGVVGGALPPEAVAKLTNCKIMVKVGVG